jgi:hypothetical protein
MLQKAARLKAFANVPIAVEMLVVIFHPTEGAIAPDKFNFTSLTREQVLQFSIRFWEQYLGATPVDVDNPPSMGFGDISGVLNVGEIQKFVTVFDYRVAYPDSEDERQRFFGIHIMIMLFHDLEVVPIFHQGHTKKYWDGIRKRLFRNVHEYQDLTQAFFEEFYTHLVVFVASYYQDVDRSLFDDFLKKIVTLDPLSTVESEILNLFLTKRNHQWAITDIVLPQVNRSEREISSALDSLRKRGFISQQGEYFTLKETKPSKRILQ